MVVELTEVLSFAFSVVLRVDVKVIVLIVVLVADDSVVGLIVDVVELEIVVEVDSIVEPI